MPTKTTDSKGRVTLGERFANRTVLVEEIDATEVRITIARVVPEREMWLHENRAASAAVRRGLADAKAGRLTPGPDLAADAALADRLQD
jgi:predicted transcriptional regulator